MGKKSRDFQRGHGFIVLQNMTHPLVMMMMMMKVVAGKMHGKILKPFHGKRSYIFSFF